VTMMEAIKKVREREREMTHLIWCFGKLVATTHGFPRQCSKHLLLPRARPTRPWIGPLSCGSLLMHVLWILAVLIAETRRCIAGDRLAMAKPGSIE
jgi:hypothetical protein